MEARKGEAFQCGSQYPRSEPKDWRGPLLSPAYSSVTRKMHLASSSTSRSPNTFGWPPTLIRGTRAGRDSNGGGVGDERSLRRGERENASPGEGQRTEEEGPQPEHIPPLQARLLQHGDLVPDLGDGLVMQRHGFGVAPIRGELLDHLVGSKAKEGGRGGPRETKREGRKGANTFTFTFTDTDTDKGWGSIC